METAVPSTRGTERVRRPVLDLVHSGSSGRRRDWCLSEHLQHQHAQSQLQLRYTGKNAVTLNFINSPL